MKIMLLNNAAEKIFSKFIIYHH